MNFHRIMPFLFIACLFGCGLPGASVSAAPAARIHWVGLDQVNADTNSDSFMKVWHLPETAALVNQTLDKLSRWPAAGATNTASQALRPLLNDLISSETYVEIYCPTNPKSEIRNPKFLLALRLPPARATLWQTNLASALATLTGAHPVATLNGWQLQQTNGFGRIELARNGKWTLIAVGPDVHELLPPFTARVTSASASLSNIWLEADGDVANLAAYFPTINHQLSTINRLSFTLSGSSGQLLTHATVALSQPWTAPLPPWNIPTNFLHQSATSFTAIRGLASGLAALPAWKKAGLTPAPDQAYFWSVSGNPFATCGWIPMPDASNQLNQLSVRLVREANPWLVANAEGSFEWQADASNLKWNKAMIISPWVRADVVNHQDGLLGGLVALPPDDVSPPPPGFLKPLHKSPDLVFYHAELTGDRIEDYLFITQMFRIIFHRQQLPPESAGTRWLKNVEPLLGSSTTEITRTNPRTLALARLSTIGFNALELHLLADWLESPQFPRGLHTFLAPPDQ